MNREVLRGQKTAIHSTGQSMPKAIRAIPPPIEIVVGRPKM